MSVDAVIKVATDGKGKSPPFKDKLSADDIKAVSQYVVDTFMK